MSSNILEKKTNITIVGLLVTTKEPIKNDAFGALTNFPKFDI